VTSLVFMLLFFAGTAPDVMKSYGTGWEKVADQWNPPVVASEGHGDAHH